MITARGGVALKMSPQKPNVAKFHISLVNEAIAPTTINIIIYGGQVLSSHPSTLHSHYVHPQFLTPHPLDPRYLAGSHP